jgi:hypothetical protein
MKIKIKLEYTIQMYDGHDWVDIHQNFDTAKPLDVFTKDIIKDTVVDAAVIDNIISETISELTNSFAGTLERLKDVEFSYTQEME